MGAKNKLIKGIAGVIIWTANAELLTRFYRDILDMEPVTQRDGFIAFQFGDLRLTITDHSEVDGEAKDPLRIMVNLAVDDIHSAYQRLHAKGVEFLREPEKEHWGGYVATFKDPDGNVLQLLQQPSVGS